MNFSARLAAVGRQPTDAEWNAITGRRSTPPFLFVVTSTGILCTPGCPARTPGRDRIRIVDGPAESLAVGARACLRCRPDRTFGFEAPVRHGGGRQGRHVVASAVDRLGAALEQGDEPPSDRALAAELSVPERRLRELFREVLGVTPRAWVAARRAEHLRARLSDSQDVTAALYDAGYGSSSAAYEAANGGLGMTPGRYRAGAAGESIRWTVAPIPEGVALVGATARGLCSVLMGRDVETLAGELHAEFPYAAIARDDAGLSGLAGLVSDLAVGRRRPDADTLPLDVHATAFRRRVWEALRRIPAGQTRSYGEIAVAVGAPGAARAVGTACAENPVPIVVPCHRVVAANGKLGGYSGGLARKRQLLAAEGARVEGVNPADRLGGLPTADHVGAGASHSVAGVAIETVR
jgi:AraC family transcriptional regulator of adaptative response/methylated-DNA-[protein]-cysteine methyltransferase